MLAHKRKRTLPQPSGSENDSDENDSFLNDEFAGGSDSEVDISSALAGKRQRVEKPQDGGDDSDDALTQMIQDSIAKRNVKGGADVLKKAKGKGNKLVKGEIGGGSFQSMGRSFFHCFRLIHPEYICVGLHPSLLRSLTLQGYRIPTPIQRASIPSLLTNPPRDLVGMARTGSGKSLAYMVPLVQRLSGRHATAFGARALILLPTRELALQILKVGKELARGWVGSNADHAGDGKEVDDKKGQSLRWGLIVGGEGLDEQFEMVANNPDV